MIVFRVVPVLKALPSDFEGWAVQRNERNGLQIIVSRTYRNRGAAETEADRLNKQTAVRIMG